MKKILLTIILLSMGTVVGANGFTQFFKHDMRDALKITFSHKGHDAVDKVFNPDRNGVNKLYQKIFDKTALK